MVVLLDLLAERPLLRGASNSGVHISWESWSLLCVCMWVSFGSGGSHLDGHITRGQVRDRHLLHIIAAVRREDAPATYPSSITLHLKPIPVAYFRRAF